MHVIIRLDHPKSYAKLITLPLLGRARGTHMQHWVPSSRKETNVFASSCPPRKCPLAGGILFSHSPGVCPFGNFRY